MDSTLPQVGTDANASVEKPVAFFIPNLSTHAIERLDPGPWDRDFEMPGRIDKSRFNHPDTKCVFMSFVEGSNPDLRVSESNPPAAVHGFFADYDSINTIERVFEERLAKGKFKGPCRPAFIAESISGKVKAAWFFETPVDVSASPALAAEFLKMLSRELRARDFTYGYDDSCEKPNLYQHLGVRWEPVAASTPVPSDLLYAIALRAARALSSKVSRSVRIPLEAVNKEVRKHWPDAPELVEGAHVNLFWLPEDDSSKTRAATVIENGIVCYSDRSPVKFMPWDKLLAPKNPDFVRNYSDTHIANVIRHYYFDGKNYWYTESLDNTVWKPVNRQLVHDFLCCSGLSAVSGKDSTFSQVQLAVKSIATTKYIDFAAPVHFDTRQVVHAGGLRILNLDTHLPAWASLEPDPTANPSEFPFIWKFVHDMWDDPTNGKDSPSEYVLEWLRKEVCAIKEGRGLGSAQQLVIAGEGGLGKSFFIARILKQIYGASANAAPYLQGATNFNGDLLKAPLWVLDDSEPAIDHKTRIKMLSRLKEVAASAQLRFEDKYLKAFDLEVHPRVVIACNSDEVSSTVVPALGASTEDKISFLLVNPDFRPGFSPVEEENNTRAEREFPRFVQYLLAREPRPIDRADKVSVRWGQRPYHHPHLRAASSDTGIGMSDEEILLAGLRFIASSFLPIYKGETAAGKLITGTPSFGTLKGDTVCFFWKDFESALQEAELPKSTERRFPGLSRKLTAMADAQRRANTSSNSPIWLSKGRNESGSLYSLHLDLLPGNVRYKDPLEHLFKDTTAATEADPF